jgi:ubiquinone/menaquinone biosynthesis C-methylase UbiE
MAGRGERPMPYEDMSLGDFQLCITRYNLAAKFNKGKIVLNVACGSGYGSNYLLDKGARMVVSGDISAETVRYGRRFYQREAIQFAILDASRLPFADNSFDTIVSLETIEHVKQYEQFLNEFRRVLKDGGEFICSTPNKGFGIPYVKPTKYHTQEFTVEEFRSLLSRFFKEIQLLGMDYWHEGESKRYERRYKVEQALKPLILSLPKHDEIVNFYRRFILHERYIKFGQTANLDEMLDEKYKPFPLVNGPPVPKWMIAVTRK